MANFEEYFNPHDFFAKVYAETDPNVTHLSYGMHNHLPQVPFLLCRPHGASPGIVEHIPFSQASSSSQIRAKEKEMKKAKERRCHHVAQLEEWMRQSGGMAGSRAYQAHRQAVEVYQDQAQQSSGMAIQSMLQWMNQSAAAGIRYEPCTGYYVCRKDGSEHKTRELAMEHMKRDIVEQTRKLTLSLLQDHEIDHLGFFFTKLFYADVIYPLLPAMPPLPEHPSTLARPLIPRRPASSRQLKSLTADRILLSQASETQVLSLFDAVSLMYDLMSERMVPFSALGMEEDPLETKMQDTEKELCQLLMQQVEQEQVQEKEMTRKENAQTSVATPAIVNPADKGKGSAESSRKVQKEALVSPSQPGKEKKSSAATSAPSTPSVVTSSGKKNKKGKAKLETFTQIVDEKTETPAKKKEKVKLKPLSPQTQALRHALAKEVMEELVSEVVQGLLFKLASRSLIQCKKKYALEQKQVAEQRERERKEREIALERERKDAARRLRREIRKEVAQTMLNEIVEDVVWDQVSRICRDTLAGAKHVEMVRRTQFPQPTFSSPTLENFHPTALLTRKTSLPGNQNSSVGSAHREQTSSAQGNVPVSTNTSLSHQRKNPSFRGSLKNAETLSGVSRSTSSVSLASEGTTRIQHGNPTRENSRNVSGEVACLVEPSTAAFRSPRKLQEESPQVSLTSRGAVPYQALSGPSEIALPGGMRLGSNAAVKGATQDGFGLHLPSLAAAPQHRPGEYDGGFATDPALDFGPLALQTGTPVHPLTATEGNRPWQESSFSHHRGPTRPGSQLSVPPLQPSQSSGLRPPGALQGAEATVGRKSSANGNWMGKIPASSMNGQAADYVPPKYRVPPTSLGFGSSVNSLTSPQRMENRSNRSFMNRPYGAPSMPAYEDSRYGMTESMTAENFASGTALAAGERNVFASSIEAGDTPHVVGKRHSSGVFSGTQGVSKTTTTGSVTESFVTSPVEADRNRMFVTNRLGKHSPWDRTGAHDASSGQTWSGGMRSSEGSESRALPEQFGLDSALCVALHNVPVDFKQEEIVLLFDGCKIAFGEAGKGLESGPLIQTVKRSRDHGSLVYVQFEDAGGVARAIGQSGQVIRGHTIRVTLPLSSDVVVDSSTLKSEKSSAAGAQGLNSRSRSTPYMARTMHTAGASSFSNLGNYAGSSTRSEGMMGTMMPLAGSETFPVGFGLQSPRQLFQEAENPSQDAFSPAVGSSTSLASSEPSALGVVGSGDRSGPSLSAPIVSLAGLSAAHSPWNYSPNPSALRQSEGVVSSSQGGGRLAELGGDAVNQGVPHHERQKKKRMGIGEGSQDDQPNGSHKNSTSSGWW